MKRIVVISDLHCGHRAGLTPPEWQWNPKCPEPERRKYAEVQALVWNFYEKTILCLKPIYALVVNGDLVDGKMPKSGGTELITADRDEQGQMAKRCIELAKPKRLLLTFGTPYHTGVDEDWEKPIARELGAPIKDHLWFEINGLQFDVRHHVSRSIIPHGRYTAIAREKLWEQLWANYEERRMSDVLIRSHVHYHVECSDGQTRMMTTPALMAYSKYGVRRCTGIVHLGLVYFDVKSKGEYEWGKELLPGRSLKSKPIQL